MDYFLPTAVETPKWETDWTTTPSPHHPIGAKGVGESPNVGGVPCFSNAVNDAFEFLGSTTYRDAARQLAHLDGGGQTSACIACRMRGLIGHLPACRASPGAASP